MYAVDGAYDYPRRHPSSPPISVDGQQDYTSAPYSDHSNQFLDRFGYAGGGASDSSYSHNNQFRDDFDPQFNYRSDFADGSRRPVEQGPAGNRPYMSSPYGSEIEGSYGIGAQDEGPHPYNSRYPMETDGGYPVAQPRFTSPRHDHQPQQQQQPLSGSGQYQPYYRVEGPGRNGGGPDEALSDQLSSTRDEVNPLDERFSEQDTNPLDERFSDIAAMNQRFGAGQGLPTNDRNDLVGPNDWNPSSQRRDENFHDEPVHDSMLRLSIQDIRPGLSPSPYSQQRPNNAVSVQPVNMPSHRSPSVNSQVIDSKWRNPDLREVIDYLNHQNDAIKANAAAYLQHLCYMDDNIKAQTRVLRGIPALVDLVSNPLPEVHRAACGALRNLSYGRANDENKIEIKNVDGITVLVRLLRKTADNDIREVITGILWNLSSCADIKKAIIDEGIKSIVDVIVIPMAGWGGGTTDNTPTDAYRSTVFRNASGILRNVSSDGEYARKKLRECEGLVESVITIIRSAMMCNDMDNKSVENCVCLLRNLSYACQEIIDPDYLKKRSVTLAKKQDDSVGCFGGKNKKKNAGKDSKGGQNGQIKSPVQSHPARGMELLWHKDIVRLYLQLLQECSNPDTLEAAAGAIQNLAACDWQPSVDIRNSVRMEKGIPIIVELIKEPSDKVVCAAATTLRNLALDEKNKQLIGKYVMHDMVSKLPSNRGPAELTLSNETIAAMEATLYEVVKSSSEFAKLLIQEGGIERLMHIVRSPVGIYSEKVVRYASQLLQKMWSFAEFHEEYKRKGWKQSDFVSANSSGKSLPPSAENTINRPRMAQSGPSMPGYNDRTMVIDRHPQQQRQHQYADDSVPGVVFSSGPNTDNRLNLTDKYPSQNRNREDIPLSRMEYPVDSSREILYFNSTDRIPQDLDEHHSFPPGYDLPAYRAEPPKYEGHDYPDPGQGGYGASGSQLNRYSGSVEDSYGSQAKYPQGDVRARGDPVGNSFDSQHRDVNYQGGYDDYPTIQTREQEPVYSRLTKPDRYGDMHLADAEGKGQDVDSWV